MRRPSIGRVLTIVTSALLLFALSFFLEPRKTTHSCKTVASCLGLSNRHGYYHTFPVGEALSTEAKLQDGSLAYERRILAAETDVLFLVLTKDASSWSKDFRSQQRNVYDLLDVLVSTKLNLSRASIALLTSSEEEYAKLVTAAQRFPFARMLVIFKPEAATGSSIPYDQRHNPALQQQRRSAIAALRNYLMLRGLLDEKHIFWLDADIVELSPGILQQMLYHSETNVDAGLITARCYQHLMDNYDKNAWKISASQDTGVVHDSDREVALQTLVQARLDVPALLQGSGRDDLIPLDSVGGTLLYMRAGLVRQGLVFPTFNVVGTTWSQPGWIGVETEGLCYLAKSLKGGACFILGDPHYVRHSDLG